jgi:TonB-linked SusC/RagA family outer membrane protein
MMRKQKRLLLLSLLFFSITLFSQRTITGKISSAKDNVPIPGVSVLLKGSTRGATTAGDGMFSLNVPNGAQTLIISYIGFATKEISVGAAESSANVSLDEDSKQIGEVVVVALGNQRQKKSLGYATQQVTGGDLAIARDNNMINGLSGKVAGLNITRGSSGPGASTRLQLRGDRSLQGYNQPLYVIDGVPIDNTIRGGTGEFNGSDGGDAIGNIAPDDIESVSVLKGANAAAQYGARAANGVVIITTKKGRTQKGLGISYSFSYGIENPAYKLKIQDQYGRGDNPTETLKSTTRTVNSWGAKITGQTDSNWLKEAYPSVFQDHIGALLQSGNTMSNVISLSTGNEKVQFRLSIGNQKENGIIPNNTFNRTTVNIRTTLQLAKDLTLDTKINYINQVLDNRPAGGEEASNPYSDVIRMPTTIRVSDLQKYDVPENGRPRNNFWDKDASIINNPYWILNNLKTQEERNRFISALTLRYEPIKNLIVQARLGMDKFFDNNDRKVFPGSPTQLSGGSLNGDYSSNTLNSTEINGDLLASYSTELNDHFTVGGSIGTAIYRRNQIFENQSAGGLDIPYLFKSSNGKSPLNDRSINEQEIQSIYATANLSYNNYLFFELTGRNDWSSTLPQQNRSFFYPSFSLSAVLSEMITLPEFISFAKLRGSYAFVGNGAETPYSFQQNLVSSNGVSGVILANNSTLVLKDLKPQQTRSLEIGAEFRFMKNRFGLDISYYKTNSINQILALPLPLSSLFQNQIINAGDIQNSGIELMLNAEVVRTKDFSWDLSVNYAANVNKLLELTAGRDSTLISSNRVVDMFAKVGQPLGDLYVRGFQRSATGEIIVGSNGLPLIRLGRPVNVGNYNPDWIGGLTNTFKYKGFALSFLIDARIGGKVVSHTQAVLATSGLTEETLKGRDGTLIVDGVTASGTKNTVAVTAQAYWNAIGGRGGPVGEAFTYSASSVRLRQLSLSYSLPQSLIGKTFLQRVDISFFARNLFFLSKDAPFDPEVSLNNGLGGQGVDFYSLPTTKAYGINVNVSF